MHSNTVNLVNKGQLLYITFPKLDACGAVKHAFSTRKGGVSNGIFSSMNLSFNRGDIKENVAENYEILCNAVGIDTKSLVFSKQTHTDNVISVDKSDCGRGFSRPSFEDVDGLITAAPDVALVTQFADCTPLLFCDPKKRVIANTHSGWRGTAKRIGNVTVEKMVSDYGCNRSDIIAAIGPCIGKCCYEVDDTVYCEFEKSGLTADGIFTSKQDGKYMLDLRLANKLILLESGIKEENIDIADLCTCCNADELFSHRATGGKRGNLAAIIQLK